MFVRARNCLLNYPVAVVKNNTRKYTVPVVSEKQNAEPQYPPILDLSFRCRQKRKKEAFHKKLKALPTVEEKLFAINMRYYYGWRATNVEEGEVHYNSLPHTQYITRTHLVKDYKLPEFYNNLIVSEELDNILQSVKSQVEDGVAFELSSRLRKQELTMETLEDESQVENIFANGVINQVNRILLANLSLNTLPHLLEADVDFEPRREAFWFAGGIYPSSRTVKAKENTGWMKEYANDLVDIPFQYTGSPVLQLRHQHPLKEIIPLSESENGAFDVPTFRYDPRTLGYRFNRKSAATIPGFWPGDPSEFGILSYHNRGHLLKKLKNVDYNFEALAVQAILASYTWLFSQACYQGFSPFHDVTYPLTTQTIITNGQWWSFCAYQLNTVVLHSENSDENPRRNICWITEPMKLFDKIENNKVCGLNEDTLKTLLKFYINAPQERSGINMKPYLGEDVKKIADYEDPEKRAWLENTYKHLTSHRPRHRRIPEVDHWQKIYLMDHQTRPLDRKFYKWQYGQTISSRRLDDHAAPYIPKKIRADPRRKQKERFAKQFYPDVN